MDDLEGKVALVTGASRGVGAATAVALVSRALMTIGDLVTAGVAAGFTRRPGAAAATTPDEELPSRAR